MAGSKYICPECESVLKFSKPIAPGKSVRCNKCDTVFKTPDEEDEEPAGKAKAKTKNPSEKVTAKKPVDKPAKGDGKAAKSADAEEDKTYGVHSEDVEEHKEEDGKKGKKGKEKEKEKPKINYAPDTSVRDLRGPAQALVIQPTNLMLLCGALGFFGYVGLFIALMIPIVTPLSSDVGSQNSPVKALEMGHAVGIVGSTANPILPGKGDGDLEIFVLFGADLGQIAFFSWYQIILYLAPLVVGAFYSLIAILGAVRAQNLESRGWGIASAIMIMFPITIAGFTVDVLLFLNFAMGVMFDPAAIDLILMVLAVVIPLVPLAVGIKALIAFFKPEVIAGFEYVPD